MKTSILKLILLGIIIPCQFSCTIHRHHIIDFPVSNTTAEDNCFHPYKGKLITYVIKPTDNWPIVYTVITDSVRPLNLSSINDVIYSSFHGKDYYVPDAMFSSILDRTYRDIYSFHNETIDIFKDEIMNLNYNYNTLRVKYEKEEKFILSDSSNVSRSYVDFYGLLYVKRQYLYETTSIGIEAWRYKVKQACIPLLFNVIPTKQNL